ncbi:putative ubiquitin-conjugating enzyme, partial [Leishmania braziliensis MHOM/BR/75/M2904]
MPLTAAGMRTLMRQMQEVQEHPIDGVQVRPSDSISEYHVDLDGPEGTPFAAGRFHVVLVFDEQYPEVPPKGFFRTKIFHPNISERGDICVNALKRDWSSTLGLRHILAVIRCLLIEPNPESALNEEAGRLILEEYA